MSRAGTIDDAELLFDCVSRRARLAIGLESGQEYRQLCERRELRGMLLVSNPGPITLPATLGQPAMIIDARRRLSVRDIVWDPPESGLRSIVS